MEAILAVTSKLAAPFQRSEKAVGDWLGQSFDADKMRAYHARNYPIGARVIGS